MMRPVVWLPSHRAPFFLCPSSCFGFRLALFAFAGVCLLGFIGVLWVSSMGFFRYVGWGFRAFRRCVMNFDRVVSAKSCIFEVGLEVGVR